MEVPDTAGFVVNRLLFPFLFDAVRLMENDGLHPGGQHLHEARSGAPDGPLRLLDFVGLDVAVAIGEAIGTEAGDGPPPGGRGSWARSRAGASTSTD